MKNYKVAFRPLAEVDLFALYDYIESESGPEIAGAYIDRIEAACTALETLPERGVPRDDISSGLRILSLERRVAIAYQVTKSEVVIIRIFYGGQDYARMLRPKPK